MLLDSEECYGQLSAGETANLERKEASLNREENRMEKRDNGNLTAADKTALSRRENRLSRQIYRDKHNGLAQNTAPYGHSLLHRDRDFDAFERILGLSVVHP
jgi:hypothetical protein